MIELIYLVGVAYFLKQWEMNWIAWLWPFVILNELFWACKKYRFTDKTK